MFNIEKTIIIGAGGTGSILLPSLIRFLRSRNYKNKIIIADGDKYSDSNIDRQTFAITKSGMNKAEYQSGVIVSHIPDMKNQIEFIDKFLSKEDISVLIEEKTLVINCVDNPAARKYVEDYGDVLNNFIHICCGNEESTGQVQISIKKDGKRITPSIYKYSPNFDSTRDDRSGLSCEELANLPSGGQIIAANMMAASLALNYLLQIFDDHVFSSATFFNCYTNKNDVKNI
jgi:molybdopterin/thiamine biosynthesis adenylyltransferase